jgi:hypothetical protein
MCRFVALREQQQAVGHCTDESGHAGLEASAYMPTTGPVNVPARTIKPYHRNLQQHAALYPEGVFEQVPSFYKR